jgi:AraC-like DNA-binding protein
LSAQHRRRERIGRIEQEEIGFRVQICVQADINRRREPADLDFSRRGYGAERRHVGVIINLGHGPARRLRGRREAANLPGKRQSPPIVSLRYINTTLRRSLRKKTTPATEEDPSLSEMLGPEVTRKLPKSHSRIETDLSSSAFSDRRLRQRRASIEILRMAQSGTVTFVNPDEYGAAIKAARVNVIVTGGGDFNARLTWLTLDHLYLLHSRENLSRIGLFSFSPKQACITFPTKPEAPLTYGGFGLRFGEVVLHSRGERTHQRTNGPSQWGLISLSHERLAACTEALTGTKIISPPEGRVLRPPRYAARRLLLLHRKVCRLVETRQELIVNPEIKRALEQELLQVLVGCLGSRDFCGSSKRQRHHADVMIRFEDALASYSEPHLNLPALCSAIGVPERTLRMCSADILGMSPSRYHLLRRLNGARSELLSADPETTSVTEIAHNHQFLELGRFAVAYRTFFGEMPSFTLRHSTLKTA